MAETIPTIEVTPQWEPYLDMVEDVLPWLQIASVQEAKANERIRLVTSSICMRVQNYLGKPIGQTEFFKRFSGWPGANGAVLALPYYPILKVIRVSEYRGTSGPFLLTEQTPETQAGNSETFQVEPLSGMLIRTFMGNIQRPWFPGSKNIEVTWVAGYNPTPDDIKLATLEYIKKWWDSTQQASRNPQPAGSLGYQGLIQPTTAGAWGELQRTLDFYAQQGIG